MYSFFFPLFVDISIYKEPNQCREYADYSMFLKELGKSRSIKVCMYITAFSLVSQWEDLKVLQIFQTQDCSFSLCNQITNISPLEKKKRKKEKRLWLKSLEKHLTRAITKIQPKISPHTHTFTTTQQSQNSPKYGRKKKFLHVLTSRNINKMSKREGE